MLRKDFPRSEAGAVDDAPPRFVKIWRREAKPLILVALFTYFFADVDILIVTRLLASADTAIIGLCLKLALLVGFAVQVAHQVVVPIWCWRVWRARRRARGGDRYCILATHYKRGQAG